MLLLLINSKGKQIYFPQIAQISAESNTYTISEYQRNQREQKRRKHISSRSHRFPQKVTGIQSANISVISGRKKIDDMKENDISYIIRGVIFKVYNTLGPGLLESVYVAALMYELKKEGLSVSKEVAVPVYYNDEKLEKGFRLDILVEDKVIIEVKSVQNLAEVHHKQVLTYLKLTKLKLAILVNFNVDEIIQGIFRKVNNL